jgi:hypothetical protein
MLQSDVAFTRLSLSGTYDRAYSIFREQWLLFLTVAAAAFVPLILILITYGREVGEVFVDAKDAAASGETFDFSGDLLTHMKAVLTKLTIEWIFQTLVGTTAQAAISFTVAHMYTERLSSLKECVKKSVQRFCNIFLAGLLVGLGLLVACIVVGIVYGILFALFGNTFLTIFGGILVGFTFAVAYVYLSVAVILVPPVVMIENRNPVQTIKRCWELAYNNRCYIFCTIFLVAVANNIISRIILAVMALVDPSAPFSPWGLVCASGTFLFFFPYMAM